MDEITSVKDPNSSHYNVQGLPKHLADGKGASNVLGIQNCGYSREPTIGNIVIIPVSFLSYPLVAIAFNKSAQKLSVVPKNTVLGN